LVSRQAALDDPITAQFAQKEGQLIIWYGSDRRVIMYPCDKNRQLNFVCIHPREESEVGKLDGKLTAEYIHNPEILTVNETGTPAVTKPSCSKYTKPLIRLCSLYWAWQKPVP